MPNRPLLIAFDRSKRPSVMCVTVPGAAASTVTPLSMREIFQDEIRS
ncbi:MAG: hypothetical protein IPP94_17970 [Ignavibacteria bacterium]|nr:hypothetical protein [Ignavibacteria bacterium]